MMSSASVRKVLASTLGLGFVLAMGSTWTAHPRSVLPVRERVKVRHFSVSEDSAPAPATITSALFAHVAVGGGYTTVFTFLNTGTDAVEGDLILTSSDGVPLEAALSSASDSREGSPPVHAATAAILIPPGGVQFVEAGALSGSDPTRTGWARVESDGGVLSGVATFQQTEGGTLKTIAGVLASAPVTVVTIPVNDDASRGRFTGYAVANPGPGNLGITIVVVNSDGTPFRTLQPPELDMLGPGRQVARFLFQDLGDPNLKFEGSMVMISPDGAQFSVVALVQDSGLFTAIPVIPDKAPHINSQ